MNSFKPNPNYNIEVFDQILSYDKITEIDLFVKKLPYFPINFDNGPFDGSNKPKLVKYFFHQDMSLEDENKLFVNKFLNLIPLIFKKNLDFSFFKSMQVNLSDFSTVDLIHVDGAKFANKTSYTILYYSNIKWDINYGGETLFYDPNNLEIISAIQPKPGRFVVFDSTLPHSARPIQSNCPYLRYTIAVKTNPI